MPLRVSRFLMLTSATLWRSTAPHAQELDDLTGWRSWVSFLLELGDVATPLLRSLLSRLSAAVSWLLVTLIGRSLGLVFRGVRESVRGNRRGGRRGEADDRRGGVALQGRVIPL